MTLRGLVREPLVHFLLLGALLFALYGWLNRQGFAAPDEILVSQQQVEGGFTTLRRSRLAATRRARNAVHATCAGLP
jgi:hypothetical protein